MDNRKNESQMMTTIERIKNLYDEIDTEHRSLFPAGPYNNKDYRQSIKSRFSQTLGQGILVKCDEENNPPDVVYSNKLNVQLLWTENFQDFHCDLQF